MKEKFINGFLKGNKQCDKYCACVRCGRFTFFQLSFDISARAGRIMVLNIGVDVSI